MQRRMPVGAEVVPGGVQFRVWAPAAKRLDVVTDAGETPLEAEPGGYWSATVPGLGDGSRYGFRIDGGEKVYPDPATRYQPDGPHGRSQVVDPSRFLWSDGDWKGASLAGRILYELHVGTFTPEGTWAAAEKQLPELADAGIDCIEMMPVAEFPGAFGWGYDGVDLFAPSRLYGTPDDLRRFVDTAHRHGIAVILDVVYNHLGPDGNYLGAYTRDYFSTKHKTEWGEAINFDGENSGPVREFFLANAAYWIDEFHFDGLRLDATQNVYDDAPPETHILSDIGRAVRKAANGRATIVINENESQHSELCRPVENGGYGLDGLWNDDFHHSAMVALTGRNEAYYTDYLGAPQEFVSCAKYGYLYQGQWYSWQSKGRGRLGFDLQPTAFVTFTQNHDQVANSGRGLRAHQLTSPGRHRAMTAVLLLSPGTPMLFQGQEFAASAPFFYFADHDEALAKLVEAGRVEFLTQFRSLTDRRMHKVFAPPHARETFKRCKLDFTDRERNAPLYKLTKDLIRLRKSDPALDIRDRNHFDGAVLGDSAFVFRYFAEDGYDRLLLVNLGRDLHLRTCPEPLLAPPCTGRWRVALSTEAPEYGGSGVGPIETLTDGWRLAGESATVLAAVPRADATEEEFHAAPGRRIVY